MPPYKRLIRASAAALLKEVKFLAGKPIYVSVVSVKEKSSPRKNVSTSAEAVEITLCPLLYSGNGGVCKSGFHFSSIYPLTAVSGRIRLLRYFSSQQLIKAS